MCYNELLLFMGTEALLAVHSVAKGRGLEWVENITIKHITEHRVLMAF